MPKPALFLRQPAIMKFPARTAARSRSFLPVFATELSYMLLAANQDSGCITCFRRDEKAGRLEPEKRESPALYRYALWHIRCGITAFYQSQKSVAFPRKPQIKY